MDVYRIEDGQIYKDTSGWGEVEAYRLIGQGATPPQAFVSPLPTYHKASTCGCSELVVLLGFSIIVLSLWALYVCSPLFVGVFPDWLGGQYLPVWAWLIFWSFALGLYLMFSKRDRESTEFMIHAVQECFTPTEEDD